eukprot:70364_1
MTETLDKIDVLLSKYYTVTGRNDYFVNGIGKFKMFCKNNSDYIDQIATKLNVNIELNIEENSEDDSDSDNWATLEEELQVELLVNIDNDFPFTNTLQTENQKGKEILNILQYLCDNFVNDTIYIKQPLNWNNITNIINFELD